MATVLIDRQDLKTLLWALILLVLAIKKKKKRTTILVNFVDQETN